MTNNSDHPHVDVRTEELVAWLQAQPALASHLKVLLVRLLGIQAAAARDFASA